MVTQPRDPQQTTPTIFYFSVWDKERVFHVDVQDEMIIGWAADDTDIAIDLTPYHARLMGVSRQHASITTNDKGVFIKDLESTSGTLLNGMHLETDRHYALHDGDEIRIGSLYLTIHFTEA
ncbi:MAG: FHA domain-containing protein [Chloroflexota bacterium]